MRNGYDADDLWIMVEDEFLATAKLFTQHLHHAEYQRLKRQAEDLDAGNITRPVDNRTTLPLSVKREMESKRQDDRMTNAAEQGDNDDRDPWQHDPLLGALMDSPSKSGRLLTQSEPVRSKTRAAAGFLSTSQESPKRNKVRRLPPESDRTETIANAASRTETNRGLTHKAREDNVDENDSDDLDRPVRQSKVVVKRKPPSPSPFENSAAMRSKAAYRPSTSSIFARYSKTSTSPVRTTHSSVLSPTQSIKADAPTRYDTTTSQSAKMSRAEIRAAIRAKSTFKFDSWADDEPLSKKHTSSATDILKKRTFKLEKLDRREDKFTDDTKDTNKRPTTTLEIPTFLDL